MTQEQAEQFGRTLALLPIGDAIHLAATTFSGKTVFSTSFGEEDQVITDVVFSGNLAVRVFTLDTGRLFPETLETFQRTLDRYGKPIDTFYPNTGKVEDLVTTKGPFSFYNSVENRKECCFVRKVEPLRRALSGANCWITGLRGGQSGNRSGLPLFHWDEGFGLWKFNPLINWSLDEVQSYLRERNVPVNPLHKKGFVSIGCAPCTRAIEPDEDIRAGRWWWESSHKECGLHSVTTEEKKEG